MVALVQQLSQSADSRHRLLLSCSIEQIREQKSAGFYPFRLHFGHETLYLCHMPRFMMERHMYQVVLRATLPADVMQRYQSRRRQRPTAV